MHVSRKTLHVEWGDCDPAGIVFYPQYLKWFDGCTSSMFEGAGLPLPALFKQYGIIGIPVVDLKVKFMIPSSFGEELLVESTVVEWRRTSFLIAHRFLKGGTLAVEGVETRVWTGIDPKDPQRLKSQPIPTQIVETFSRINSGAANPK